MEEQRFPRGLMGTCCIPWDEEYRLLEPLFRQSIRHSLASTNLLYIFGTAGEGYAVTESQFDQIVAAFSDEMHRGGAEPMVGVIHMSTGTVVERIARCRAMEVRRFQISLPCWGAVSDKEMFGFFQQICASFPDCMFMHYNLPRAKRMVSGKEYNSLAREFPNLAATKNCGDTLSHIRSLVEDAPQLQHFLSESGFVYGSLFGPCSILVSLTMNWPKIRTLFEAGCTRNISQMVEVQRQSQIVLRTLFETVSEGRIDGSYDKLFEKMHHPEFPLRLLPPYIGSTDEEFRDFVRLLRLRLPEWVPSAICEQVK